MKIHKEFEWMKKFLDGPEWFYVSALERTANPYRSPTVAIVAWSLGWLFRLLTVPGRLIIPAAVLILMYSSISLDSPVRKLAIMLFMIFLADFVIGWFFRPKFKLSRKLPERVRAGSLLKASYQIVNLRRFSAWDIRVDYFKLKPGLNWVEHASSGVVRRDRRFLLRRCLKLRAAANMSFSPRSPILHSRWGFSNGVAAAKMQPIP